MTLLQALQKFTKRMALPVPGAAMASSDAQVIQMIELLEEGCKALADRGAWEKLIKEATWVTTATEDQGALSTLAPDGFNYLIPKTLFNRTQNIPLGPVHTPQSWQAIKASTFTGPYHTFRIRGGKFLVSPVPTAGETWAFEYVSKWFLSATAGAAASLSEFDNDLNDILFPEAIVLMDLKWRWRSAKGMRYEEDFNSAERMILNALGRDGTKQDICLDDGQQNEPKPGVIVSPGNWPL